MLARSFDELQIFLVDDGSTDGSALLFCRACEGKTERRMKRKMIETVGVSRKLTERFEATIKMMPIAEFLKIRIAKIEKGACECEMELDPARHGNPNGTVQGGALSTLADITTSYAVASIGTGTCTVSGKIDMLRGKTPEGVLTCRAEVVKAGGTLVWTDMKIRDEAGSLVAKGEYLNFRIPLSEELQRSLEAAPEE